ncbi:MAG: glycosyltransferase family 4 protein [Candidatus Promineifilaceae bacterium]
MRVLVLASYVPSLYKGAEIRLFQLLRHLGRSHEITLWAINRRGVPKEEIAALLPDCELILEGWPPLNRGGIMGRIGRNKAYRWLQEQQSLFTPTPTAIDRIYHPALKRQLHKLLTERQFDLIHVNQIMVWQYLPQPLTTPVILCKDNVWADLAERETQAAGGILARRLKHLDAQRMRRYETAAITTSNHCVVVSEQDADLVHEMAPDIPLSVIPNGVDTDYFCPTPETAEHSTLVFTGAMGWQPNADAMLYFCNEVLPCIQKDFPDVQLAIVGLHPPEAIKNLSQQPQIHVTGFVPDVRPYIANASVYIVPLRAGSGTRLKVLEALAMGKAVVSTRIGAEGLEVDNGRHLLLADDPEEFATAVSDLLQNPARRRSLGQAGRALVEASYDWKAIAADLDTVYHQVTQTVPVLGA